MIGKVLWDVFFFLGGGCVDLLDWYFVPLTTYHFGWFLRLETLKTFGAWFWDLIVFLSECTHYLTWIFGKW